MHASSPVKQSMDGSLPDAELELQTIVGKQLSRRCGVVNTNCRSACSMAHGSTGTEAIPVSKETVYSTAKTKKKLHA
eukprot:2864312-Amphidinium_carterae.2